MAGKVRVSGTFRTASAIKVKVAGTWKGVTQAYVKISGEWRQWFSTGIVDTFSRTTSGGLGTSESSIPWNASFGTWTANGSVAVSSNSVSSGNAGALAYVSLGNKNALTSVSTPSAGVGPAFWVTSAGSWWGAHLTSDQTNTTYSYNCNCTCNGHNVTTCNTCTNSAFGTYSCPTTYTATASTSTATLGNPTTGTAWQYQGTATTGTAYTPLGPATVSTVTTWSYVSQAVGGFTTTYPCPSGSESGHPLNTRCYSYSETISISSCASSYPGSYSTSSTPCTSCNATVNGSPYFVGCCLYSPTDYAGCRSYVVSGTWTYTGTTTSATYSCTAPYENNHPSATSCYQPVTTTTYDCTGYATSDYNPADGTCYKSYTTYSCPSGQYTSHPDVNKCYSSYTTYDCVTPWGSGAYYDSVSGKCKRDSTVYSCPSGGTNAGNSSTCTIAATCNNSGTDCTVCGSTTTFVSGGTANTSTGAGCDSYGFTCQTCTGGTIVNNYYLQIIYSTSTGAPYTVYSTSSLLASQPTSIQVSTGNNTATVTPFNGTTSLGAFTATNTGTKGTNFGIVKAYAGTVNQGTTVDNFSTSPLDIAPISATVEYLVVGGGGGGGNVAGGGSYGGGGGAGGLLTGTVEVALNAEQTITIGAGGAGGTYASSPHGKNGYNSVFGLFTAVGGGGGGRGTYSGGCYDSAGSAGGSGGGGPCGGGAGTAGQGYAGSTGGTGGASGGGGAGGAGTTTGGGLGVDSSITGTATSYAGGGYIWSYPGQAVANSGRGGGAASYQNQTSEGGSSGVVVIAYPDTFPQLIITGSLTYTPGSRSGYRVYKFTGGTGTIIIDTVNVVADYLAVAGGGGGGNGGGGGGGYLQGVTALTLNATTTITVGAGGAGGGLNGSNSVLGTAITAYGGGGGAWGIDGTGGNNGASGGGGAGNGTSEYVIAPGGSAIWAGQGYAGGEGGGLPRGGNGGGGGGAGGVGQSGFTGVGNGGVGKANTLATGGTTYYAGGGGGKPYNAFQSPSSGGLGGGAPSSTWASPYSSGSPGPSAGTANTGGGGGGYFTIANGGTAGYGGSGIVILVYPTSYGLAKATTGSPTQTTVGSYYVYKYTGSGSITF